MEPSRKWTFSETMLAFELYCKTPTSKIAKTNPEIIELAKALGRTPSAVGLKMANLQSFDPTSIKSGKVGMRNASKLDEEVVTRFINDWPAALREIAKAKAELLGIDESSGVEGDHKEGAEVERIVKARVGQDFFRQAVSASYSGLCCITGIMEPELLRASHIKPWSACENSAEKTDPRNGLLLNGFHDLAFDRGFFTIDRNLRVVVSKRARGNLTLNPWLNDFAGCKIRVPSRFGPLPEYISYHNDEVFIG